MFKKQSTNLKNTADTENHKKQSITGVCGQQGTIGSITVIKEYNHTILFKYITYITSSQV